LAKQGIGQTGHWPNRALAKQGIGQTGHWPNRALAKQGIGQTGHTSPRLRTAIVRTEVLKPKILGNQDYSPYYKPITNNK
jgi:hypothetical protein